MMELFFFFDHNCNIILIFQTMSFCFTFECHLCFSQSFHRRIHHVYPSSIFYKQDFISIFYTKFFSYPNRYRDLSF